MVYRCSIEIAFLVPKLQFFEGQNKTRRQGISRYFRINDLLEDAVLLRSRLCLSVQSLEDGSLSFQHEGAAKDPAE